MFAAVTFATVSLLSIRQKLADVFVLGPVDHVVCASWFCSIDSFRAQPQVACPNCGSTVVAGLSHISACWVCWRASLSEDVPQSRCGHGVVQNFDSAYVLFLPCPYCH